MKRNAFRFAVTLSLTLMLAGLTVLANPDLRVRATIPFEFSVGSKTLPAGKYIVKPVSDNGLLVLQNVDDRRQTAMVHTSGLRAVPGQEQSRIVFRKYGDQYFLSQIWPGGIAAGFESGQSVHERELIKGANKHLARTTTKPETVSVPAQ
jgi:hypothetical protein